MTTSNRPSLTLPQEVSILRCIVPMGECAWKSLATIKRATGTHSDCTLGLELIRTPVTFSAVEVKVVGDQGLKLSGQRVQLLAKGMLKRQLMFPSCRAGGPAHGNVRLDSNLAQLLLEKSFKSAEFIGSF